MYTDEDLQRAADAGIFKPADVARFRAFIRARTQSPAVDEENFKLISSFNDIFVLIACALLLYCAAWVSYSPHQPTAAIVVAALSWGLAEFFVLRRKMALPGIALLVSFVGACFMAVITIGGGFTETSLMQAGAISSIAAWLHWRRFHVPITVAAGTVALLVFICALLLYMFHGLRDYISMLMVISGVILFFVAMRWDSQDIQRVSGRSDVAFWLHLAAAPLIVHPVFSSLGILEGNQSSSNLAIVLLLYLVLSIVSLVIDRRAFMVSSLIYVLSALTELLKTYGLASDSFAYVGLVIGMLLLMLSGFWHKTRRQLVRALPLSIQSRVPAID